LTPISLRYHLIQASPNRYADDAADEARREVLRRSTYSVDGRSLVA
jgi:hypothetical protein